MLTQDELLLIKGAVDTLGVELPIEGHHWTDGQRAICEEAISLLDREIDNYTSQC